MLGVSVRVSVSVGFRVRVRVSVSVRVRVSVAHLQAGVLSEQAAQLAEGLRQPRPPCRRRLAPAAALG